MSDESESDYFLSLPFDEVLDQLSDGNWLDSQFRLDSIIDTAMCRHNVKKSKRIHIASIIETAFNLLAREVELNKPSQSESIN